LSLGTSSWTPVRLLWTSRHVADLRIILYTSLVITIIIVISVTRWEDFFRQHLYAMLDSNKLSAAVIATECAIVVWVYQTASVRLGVVDLFASEIVTICRVITVTQTASHLCRLYCDEAPSSSIKLHAPYEHSPVFDNNSRDLEVFRLQSIEAVTQFYTYLKAMCDYRHFLDEINAPDKQPETWQVLIRNVTYMLYLMLESGRNAVGELVENDASWAQYTGEILLSELVAYRLLFDVYKSAKQEGSDHDARFNRLRLREHTYRKIVGKLLRQTKSRNA
jgi:hypothetical protein